MACHGRSIPDGLVAGAKFLNWNIQRGMIGSVLVSFGALFNFQEDQ